MIRRVLTGFKYIGDPSGSGKSTLFAWMIGALSGDFRARGELWLNERRCDTLPTEHRRIGILFQDPLLFDHFSVGQNLKRIRRI